jgi:rhodanese-related sulfurtransferase
MAPGHQTAVKKILLEAVLVVVSGAVFALAANRLSPWGLALTRNYFPEGTGRLMSALPRAGTNSTAPDLAQLLAAELKEKGLQAANGRQVVRLFRDPRCLQNLIVFIDARDEQRYRAGHIPGAYEFDPYRPETYFAEVLPVCQAAEQIVVYCNGGDCDDSVTAAILLRDVGIANQKIMIYTGGITEWITNRLPVELGKRNSDYWERYGK